tara:strand:- start:1631 stop:1834 length:204 start_codon:yes stop_codon:yes gene_type:complete
METRKRTYVKAIIWNLIGLVTMILVGLIATGSIKVGGAMALVNAALGLSMYVIYERVWARLGWGREV